MCRTDSIVCTFCRCHKGRDRFCPFSPAVARSWLPVYRAKGQPPSPTPIGSRTHIAGSWDEGDRMNMDREYVLVSDCPYGAEHFWLECVPRAALRWPWAIFTVSLREVMRLSIGSHGGRD